MKIVPYRVLFEADLNAINGKYRYGKPTEQMLPVQLSEDGSYYQAHTHDRGDNEGPGPYYQIAFRIEDPSPYKIEGLRLCIDPSINKNSDEPIDNDLYCDEKTRFDSAKNLWYQQSIYERDKNDQWRVVGANKKGSLRVDSITTSGVFRVVVYNNGILLPDETTPWIYILPSSISKIDHIDMLTDLVRLSELLVRDDSSTVGIGSATQTPVIVTEEPALVQLTKQMKQETEVLQELHRAIVCVMKAPSELQGKRYSKKPISQIKHYDGRVIHDYIKHSMMGKVLGVEYFEDHDTYENRIIKYILQQLKKRQPVKEPYHVIDGDDISQEVQRRFEDRTKKIEAKIEPTHRTLYLKGQRIYNPYYGLLITVNGNVVEMADRHHHHPFRDNYRTYVKLRFFAKSKCEMIFYLDHLLPVLASLKSEPSFYVDCDVENPLYDDQTQKRSLYIYNISNIRAINGQEFINNDDLDDATYNQKLYHYRDHYNEWLNITTNRSFQKTECKPSHRKEVAQESEEIEKIKADIKATVRREQAYADSMRSYSSARLSLIQLLHDGWFKGITDIDGLDRVRLTPKFQSNEAYSTIYKLLHTLLKQHPLLTCSFDVNAFGVNSTQLVYEYWVFYKLLYHLESIGFRFTSVNVGDGETNSLLVHFRNFVLGKKQNKKFSNCVLCASRIVGNNQVDIEIGYERGFPFDPKVENNVPRRLPDYYLRVYQNSAHTESHWYFFDAKYKCFSQSNGVSATDESRYRVSYEEEIQGIAIAKYINDLGTVFDHRRNAYGATKKDIRGSFIIMADVDDGDVSKDDPNLLSRTERLFGSTKSLEKDATCQQNDTSISHSSTLPAHRYGAIMLTPDHNQELRSLFQLIFEYLEADYMDDHSNLNICWRCGTTHPVERVEKEIVRADGSPSGRKFYSTCPNCNAFRVDNHCINCSKSIIKHTDGNYHSFDKSVTNNQWAFLCPCCGSPVNGFYYDKSTPQTIEPSYNDVLADDGELPF